MSNDSAWAERIARGLLAETLPRRWAHTKGVAAQAQSLASILGDYADLITAAAWLHDIGYAPALAITGFHPLDGACYLRDVCHADMRLCRLVAHHTCAVIEAQERGLADALLAEFEPEQAELTDALTYCDMTTSPDGRPLSVEERLAEIRTRYGHGHVVDRSIRRATPGIRNSARTVRSRLLCYPMNTVLEPARW
jgi:HD superfamily phosphodiesterase